MGHRGKFIRNESIAIEVVAKKVIKGNRYKKLRDKKYDCRYYRCFVFITGASERYEVIQENGWSKTKSWKLFFVAAASNTALATYGWGIKIGLRSR